MTPRLSIASSVLDDCGNLLAPFSICNVKTETSDVVFDIPSMCNVYRVLDSLAHACVKATASATDSINTSVRVTGKPGGAYYELVFSWHALPDYLNALSVLWDRNYATAEAYKLTILSPPTLMLITATKYCDEKDVERKSKDDFDDGTEYDREDVGALKPRRKI